MEKSLTITNTTIPIKAIPEKTLDTFLEGDFSIWISNLLGLTGEESAKRILIALPAIKKHFWSLGIDEVKKAFTMYVDGELQTKPMTNYFDRVLVGKIFNEYRETKKVRVSPIGGKEWKENQDYLNCIAWFDYYEQYEKLPDECSWLYYYLTEHKKVYSLTEKEKAEAYKIELEIYEKDIAKTKAMVRLVSRYFKNLIVKGNHIKDLL